MAGALGRDHDHVVPDGGCDPFVEDVEAVGEEDGGAGLEVRLDVLREHLRLHLVGEQHRDELRTLRRIGDGANSEACRLGLHPRRASPRAGRPRPECRNRGD